LNTTATKQKTKPMKLGVIDSLEVAKAHYSAKVLFVANHVHERTVKESVFAYESVTRAKRVHEFCEEAKGEQWVVAEPNIVHFWEAHSWSKISRQPQIRDTIIEAMRANPTKSFEQIAVDIGNWCSASTMAKWIASHSGYTTYALRALPLLTSVQKEKHVTFATHLRNYWNLPCQNFFDQLR
jgi:hypothetical protein